METWTLRLQLVVDQHPTAAFAVLLAVVVAIILSESWVVGRLLAHVDRDEQARVR